MKFPLLRMASEETVGLKWADWLSAQGAKLPIVTGTVFPTFSLLLLELVAARGIALGYEHIVDQLFIDRRIVRLSDKSVRTGLGFYLVYREPNRIPLETLIEVCRKGLDRSNGADHSLTGMAGEVAGEINAVALNELASLHDRRQAPTILCEHIDVGERVTVHDQ